VHMGGPVQQAWFCYICPVTDITVSCIYTAEGNRNGHRNLLEKLLRVDCCKSKERVTLNE
jgi:hypothetical protein